ncbi:MAG: 2-oxoglutarate dehydrogenase E1 component [Planctomycetota bacterium]
MADERDHSPSTGNLEYVEELYARFLREPSSVPEDWRGYFERLGSDRFSARPQLGPSFTARSVFAAGGRNGADCVEDMVALQDRVDQLIRAYRVRGHLVAKIDPLGLPRPPQPELEPEFYGLSEGDTDRTFSTRTIAGVRILTLGGILERLRNTYCRSIGVQFMHIDSLPVKNWLQDRMEGTENRLALTRSEQIRILTSLTDSVVFEDFLRKKFLGAKSFSLEGSESLIPLLDIAIEKAGEQGIDEVVIAMAHRGRLNVLRNIMDKNPSEIFREFDDAEPERHMGGWDVKYHLGWSKNRITESGRKVALSLCFNPSHLEFVNTVAMGRTRAKQDRAGDHLRQTGMTLLIHGDAAFAGEGIVQETLNLSELAGYRVGGAVHVILNNQIGFTTLPEQSRSSVYATDVAKMLQIPIFHVNGEDPEAVAQVVSLALDFRREFRRDVVIDMYAYRRFGHNEGDEPGFTQPLLYEAIRKRKSTRQGYLEHLLKLGEVTRKEADEIADEARRILEDELAAARADDYIHASEKPGRVWLGYFGGPETQAHSVYTGISDDRVRELMDGLVRLPEGFTPHKKIVKGYQLRREMGQGARPFDWGAAEMLAIASLVSEGVRVRLTGQDSERGTFSHRHSVVHDVKDGSKYMPVANLSPDQAPVEIVNSPLSEAGVLGFEYGYSLDTPDGLVLWEAQFGDFVNAAQVIIDQFIISGEDKWRRLNGLVMLLPHGFEGMGPEHSSARLERWLSLTAEDNIQIVNLTTPAQHFHALRRQVLSPWRKPIVMMSPKSLLRNPAAVSGFTEFTRGHFHPILADEIRPLDREIRRVLICSGKIYYDLKAEREKRGREDVAILRFEQLYPLHDDAVRDALRPYPEETPVYWVQEEPENMGAWPHVRKRFLDRIHDRWPLTGITRPESASPATGSAAAHRVEQGILLEAAFAE